MEAHAHTSKYTRVLRYCGGAYTTKCGAVAVSRELSIELMCEVGCVLAALLDDERLVACEGAAACVCARARVRMCFCEWVCVCVTAERGAKIACCSMVHTVSCLDRKVLHLPRREIRLQLGRHIL